MSARYTKQDCIDSLQEAAIQLGKSPSRPEYQSLDLSPSAKTISRQSSWDDMKEEAGLKQLVGGGSNATLNVNERYFESIDNPEKAYWLGMLYGDGWVAQMEKGKANIGLALNERDHIERFKKSLESDHSIDQNGTTWRLRISRKQMAEDLRRHGLDENKTHSDSLPDLPERLHPHFVRGISDADASFFERKDKNGVFWQLYGSSEQRFEKLENWLPVTAGIHRKENGEYQLQVSNQAGIKELIDWMYPEGSDTEPALPRKKEVTER